MSGGGVWWICGWGLGRVWGRWEQGSWGFDFETSRLVWLVVGRDVSVTALAKEIGRGRR